MKPRYAGTLYDNECTYEHIKSYINCNWWLWSYLLSGWLIGSLHICQKKLDNTQQTALLHQQISLRSLGSLWQFSGSRRLVVWMVAFVIKCGFLCKSFFSCAANYQCLAALWPNFRTTACWLSVRIVCL